MPDPFATPSDVADVWRPLSDAEQIQVSNLLVKASAKLRQACPFDVDERMAIFATDPTNPIALDPAIVADVVATVVKRFMVNPEGAFSSSEGVGPFSRSASFVNRYDKTGAATVGALQITESDIDQLRPAVPAQVPSTFKIDIPRPELLVPGMLRRNGPLGPTYGSVIVPDIASGDYEPGEQQ